MACKRNAESSIDVDPEYADIAQHQTKKQKTFEKDAKKATIKKIETIIKRQFSEEISNKDKEIMVLDEKIHQTRSMLDKLRACLAAKYYSSSSTANTVNLKKATSSNPQPSIHPAVKKTIGKYPSDLLRLSQPAMSDSPDVSRSNSPALDVTTSSRSSNLRKTATATLATAAEAIEHEKPSEKKIAEEIKPEVKKSVKPEAIAARGGRFKIKKRIIVGNVSRYIPIEKRDKNDRSTHKWMVYVRGPSDQPNIEGFVKKIWFFLHPSYKPNDLVEVACYPFHLTRRGWGEFPIRVQLHFRDPRNKKIDLIHNIKLDKTYTGLQTLGAETVVDIELERDAIEDIPVLSATTSSTGTPIKTDNSTTAAAGNSQTPAKKLLDLNNVEDNDTVTMNTTLADGLSVQEYVAKHGSLTVKHNAKVAASPKRARSPRKASPKRAGKSPTRNTRIKTEIAETNGMIVQNGATEIKTEFTTIKQEPVDWTNSNSGAGDAPSVGNLCKQSIPLNNDSVSFTRIKTEVDSTEAVATSSYISSTAPSTVNAIKQEPSSIPAQPPKMVYVKCIDPQGKMILLPQQFLSPAALAAGSHSNIPTVQIPTGNKTVIPNTVVNKQQKVFQPKMTSLKPLVSNRIRPPGAVSLLNSVSQLFVATDSAKNTPPVASPKTSPTISLVGSNNKMANNAAKSEPTKTLLVQSPTNNSITLSLPQSAAAASNITLTVPVAVPGQPNNATPPRIEGAGQQVIRANIGGKLVWLQMNTTNNQLQRHPAMNSTSAKTAPEMTTTNAAFLSAQQPVITQTTAASSLLIHQQLGNSTLRAQQTLNQSVVNMNSNKGAGPMKLEQLMKSAQPTIANNTHLTFQGSKLIPTANLSNNKLKSSLVKNKQQQQQQQQQQADKSITGWKAKRLAVIHKTLTDGNRPPLWRDIRLENMTDVVSLLKAVVKQYPLVAEQPSRSHYPYCAPSREEFLSWNIGKRRAAEWQRACDVRQRIEQLLNNSKKWKGQKIWTTKALVAWCRNYLYTPLEPVAKTSGNKPNEKEPQTSGNDKYQISSCTDSTPIVTRIESSVVNSTLSNCNDDVEIIDIIGMDNPKQCVQEIKIEKEESADDPQVNPDMIYISPTSEEIFIEDHLKKIGIQTDAVDIDYGVRGHLVEKMIATAMTEFMSDLLRHTANSVSQEKSFCDEITAIDLYKSIGKYKQFDFITNRSLGKPLDDLAINLDTTKR
ncbi:uncharacterized protein LOC141907535 [Tubulanus polymorphus]|uniref:uncharacterized protein LOC141907535 n=1 Tax=Tubulanus polymorphus TaxID=672921 RepID=UPI003DA29ADE